MRRLKGGVFSFRRKIAWSSLFSAAVVFPPLFYLIIILCFCQIELVKNLGSKKGKSDILYLKIIIKIKFDPCFKPDPVTFGSPEGPVGIPLEDSNGGIYYCPLFNKQKTI